MTSNLSEFQNYILDRFDSFDSIEKYGYVLRPPEFEIYAQDYLEFAE
jgi:hypothetical protein